MGDQIVPIPLSDDVMSTVGRFLLCGIRSYECIKYDRVVPTESFINF